MKDILKNCLLDKGLPTRFDLYSKYFEYVNVLNEIENPSISIVIISWRFHPNTLINLRMLEKQRDQNYELIFVDNGGLADEFNSFRPYIDTYIRLNTNTGAYLARNIGAVFSRAPIVLFLEDDGISDLDLVESHVLTHRIFNVISVRGVYLPETELQIGETSPHYYHGNNFFPFIATLEGNASYHAKSFFSVGGWDDEINFGHGGIELSIRLTELEPDRGKQIYSPVSIIYHDLLKDPDKINAKLKRQAESLVRLKKKYPHLDEYMASWKAYYHDDSHISYKTSNFNELLYFTNKCKKIERRSLIYFLNNYRGAELYSHHVDSMEAIGKITEAMNIPLAIFGSGSYGENLSEKLRRMNILPDCFYDNAPSKWGTYVNGIVVRRPEEITGNEYIIIASSWSEQISLQLEGKGLRAIRNYIVYRL